MLRPAEASAWIADSLPEPGPWTRTTRLRTPMAWASRPACSAAMVAANGVDFLDPLKPAVPADAQTSTSPDWSAMVISVLLKVALMWATPSAATTFLVFLGLVDLALAKRCLPPCGGLRVRSARYGSPMPLPSYFLGAFFLPAMARRGPFLVRALVWVRWPLTGSPRRWRRPR